MRNILIIEDDIDFAEIVRDMLEGYDYLRTPQQGDQKGRVVEGSVGNIFGGGDCHCGCVHQVAA